MSARVVIRAGLLVSAAALCILLAPPPPPDQSSLICAEVHTIGRWAHVLRNCDADGFVEIARDPSRVFDAGSMRQTRPGYAVLGWAFALPFRALRFVVPALPDPYYAGYVALNWLLMVIATILFAKLIGVSSLLAPGVLVPVSILLVNHITKAFFWTPHLQVMGLFVSIISIYAARRLLMTERRIGLGSIAGVGLASGLACLTYGAFVLVPAVLSISLWVFRRIEERWRRLTLTIVLWLSTLLPFVLWREYVISKTGSFYSHETQYYHEFVWIVERFRESPSSLAAASVNNLERFLQTWPQALLVPMSFAIAAFFLVVSRRGSMPKGVWSEPSAKAAAAFLLVAVPFYALMGFYDPRLTATLMPPLLVLLGLASRDAFPQSSPSASKFFPEPITIAAIAYIAIVIFVPGPYA